MPVPIEQPVTVPPGEARGRFVISPEPNPTATETEPGLKVEPSPAVANVESHTINLNGDATSGNTTSGTPIVIEVKPDSSKGKSLQSGGKGSEAARNSRAESGLGGVTPGKGTGTGAGRKPFSGITISGGSYDPGTAENSAPVVQAARPLQTDYGVTVISTENSGGGLPFFGVFSHEQIYTVYLDMRRAEADPAPAWTLEFAILQDTADPANESKDRSRSQEGVVLPFPVLKELPALPAELVRNHLRRMVVVYAIINIEGKMEQMSVKESPDDLLNEPLLRTLSKWIFRPARLNGEPVAVKALLGIPLWLPE
jgi:hypothetical protein